VKKKNVRVKIKKGIFVKPTLSKPTDEESKDSKEESEADDKSERSSRR
jgi:hypothetical protein